MVEFFGVQSTRFATSRPNPGAWGCGAVKAQPIAQALDERVMALDRAGPNDAGRREWLKGYVPRQPGGNVTLCESIRVESRLKFPAGRLVENRIAHAYAPLTRSKSRQVDDKLLIRAIGEISETRETASFAIKTDRRHRP